MSAKTVPHQTDRILALIPALNEADHITDVIEGARTHLPVLVVDDGSRDGTATRAENSGAIVLRQWPNQGKGTALQAGFRWALDEGFGAVVTLDADGQHDPAEIPRFLEAYHGLNADLVIGARDFRHMPFVRRFSNTIGRWSFSWAMRRPIPDNQSGYRLVSRRLMSSVLRSREVGFEFEVEMIVICVRNNFTLAWVPIRTIYAGERSHISPWHHVINFTRMVWQARREMR
jgi:glycosyltransferase involved in cell wall biosynthesis